jgi:hypothetical protein
VPRAWAGTVTHVSGLTVTDVSGLDPPPSFPLIQQAGDLHPAQPAQQDAEQEKAHQDHYAAPLTTSFSRIRRLEGIAVTAAPGKGQVRSPAAAKVASR